AELTRWRRAPSLPHRTKAPGQCAGRRRRVWGGGRHAAIERAERRRGRRLGCADRDGGRLPAVVRAEAGAAGRRAQARELELLAARVLPPFAVAIDPQAGRVDG